MDGRFNCNRPHTEGKADGPLRLWTKLSAAVALLFGYHVQGWSSPGRLTAGGFRTILRFIQNTQQDTADVSVELEPAYKKQNQETKDAECKNVLAHRIG